MVIFQMNEKLMEEKQIDFQITENAEQELRKTLKSEEILRVKVMGGGCQGYQYKFVIDKTENLIWKGENNKVVNEEEEEEECFDIVFRDKNYHPIVTIDEISIGFLQEAILDFQNDFMARTFVIKNKNAGSSCGCGASFTFKKK